jgi:regulator of sigma E protease
MMTTSIFAFAIVLGVLIFFHELGHFLVARLFGVGVEKFSLGFGPRVVGRTVGRTEYRISAIPLGGYVKMVGEEPNAELDPEDLPYSFTHKHVFKRICIVAAGPTFNLLLALLIFWGIFWVSGAYILRATVGDVRADSPAARAGLMAGDHILAIDKNPVKSWDEMSAAITNSEGRALRFQIQRGTEIRVFTITPEITPDKNLFGEEIERYIIGISSAGKVDHQPLGLGSAMVEGVRQTYEITKLTILSIIKLIQGTVSTKTLGGPIMIAEMAGQQAKEGADNLIVFIAWLSINLGVLNFLPIPVLDGGHLFFFLIEAVIGRPVNTRMREIAQQAGIFILLALMIFVFYNDITRLFLNSTQ